MISTQDINDIVGAEAVDDSNGKIGTVGQVYVDADSDQPTWVSVRSGLFGTSETLVPLQGASWDRSALHLAFSKSRVKDAPRVDPDAELSPDEQERLYDYYGLGGAAGGTSDDRTRTGSGTADVDDTTGRAGVDGAGASTGVDRGAGHDTSGTDTDDAMTRSEERLKVGTQQVETGRARLRKHIVTERQTVTVPVTHEEARIEREPITDADRGAATGADLTEEEREVVLTGERPVVDKETVPVERVRLGTQQVTEQQQVTEDVRHEEITTDDDTSGRAGR